jgi:DNA polymerase-3 subunit gamma/tau
MSLQTKHRPKDFSDIVGNKGAVEALESLLSRKKEIPQSFLFTGQRGCGKTTLARIIKNKLKCSDHDFKEYNTANSRGIDTARDIISNVYLKPMSGKVKVYLLDEFHMTTKEMQNALLKIVEEPPSHVYFIFATTEPDKIINPLKSRCTHIEVNLLSDKKIKKLITNICEKEDIELKEDVIKEIIIGAEGSPREALVLLDLIRDIEKSKNQIEAVKSHNNASSVKVKELFDEFLTGKPKWKKVRAILKGIEEEPESVRRAVLGYFTAVLLNGNTDIAPIVLEEFEDNYYSSGKAGLAMSCFRVCHS